MPFIPEIKFDDITVAKKYTGAYDYERCRNALWSIYNIIKKIAGITHPRIVECLCNIGVHGAFENDNMTAIVFSGLTRKGYKRGLPAAKYLFELEKYGFVFYDLITSKDVPRNNLAAKDITQFTLSYNANAGDFTDVIFGLKLFTDACMTQPSPLGLMITADIRVAFEGVPKIYAPPAEEVFSFLPEDQKKAAMTVHNKLEELGCIRQPDGEATKYINAKNKGQVMATIWVGERIWFIPEHEQHQKVVFKFNLRNIDKYEDYLSECTDSVIQSLIKTDECWLEGNYDTNHCANGGGKSCVGAMFTYQDKTYRKCLRYFCIFKDFSEQAVENYIKLIEFENKELKNGR